MTAPIVLFTYSRLWHTKVTIDALLLNPLARNSDLIVYSDAAKSSDKVEDVSAVREYLTGVSGFRSILVIMRDENFGLSRSIISGVTEVLTKYDRLIVLEDDMVTSPFFLSYMNEALERFNKDERIISIHGYVYPVQGKLPESFFLRGADCWGWATWRRGWALFNFDGDYLLRRLRSLKLEKSFDFNGSYDFTNMLVEQLAGINDSWAIRWYASAFLLDKLTLYPGRSLVANIGNDASGTHGSATAAFDVALSSTPISINSVDVIDCEIARAEFELYFRSSKIRQFAGRYFRIWKLWMRKIGL